jgi:hypothetical protein
MNNRNETILTIIHWRKKGLIDFRDAKKLIYVDAPPFVCIGFQIKANGQNLKTRGIGEDESRRKKIMTISTNQ